jgi:hypothetical protein
MSDISFDELVTLAENLTALEKVRLVQRVMATLEQEVLLKQTESLNSADGLSAQNIDEPRSDI